MAPLLNEHLITTKDAGELSGYTADYLSRLIRSGKISGKKIGHSWLVDKESLTRFLDEQGDRKIDYARALARAREVEYRAHRSLLHRATKALTTQSAGWRNTLEPFAKVNRLFHSQVFALAVAFLVVASGAFAARATATLAFKADAATVVRDVLYGLNETFGDIPSRIAARIDAARTNMDAQPARVTMKSSPALALRSLSEVGFDFSATRIGFSVFSGDAFARVPRSFTVSSPHLAQTPKGFLSFAITAYELVMHPSRVARASADAYVTIGTRAYAAINASLAAYRSRIEESGARTLALAASARDTYLLALAPLPTRFVMGLGESVVVATHAAIQADVAIAYVPSAAAPVVSALVLRSFGEIGRAGSALANGVSERYLVLLEGAGRLGYAGATEMISFARRTGRTLAALPRMLENASLGAPSVKSDLVLGALGKTALALQDIAAAAPALVLRSLGEAGLSPLQHAALATYRTVNTAFTSTTRALAVLFGAGTPPTIVYTSSAPVYIIAATSSPAQPAAPPSPTSSLQPTTSNSYPTYTTVVQASPSGSVALGGVSADFVNGSLETLRTGILATVSGMIQPVRTQVVQNATTIQQVNRIEDLHDLIVRNGDFRNSIFDSGVRVSATTGNFTTLTGGTTSLGATTVTDGSRVSKSYYAVIVSVTPISHSVNRTALLVFPPLYH